MPQAERAALPQPPLCKTRQAVELISDKWSTLVLHALRAHPVRFNHLRRTVVGVSHKMLAQTLRRLEHRGLVRRTVFPTVPPAVEYTLTPLGQSFLIPLMAVFDWAEAHAHELHPERFED